MANYGYSLHGCFEILVNRFGMISQSKNKITSTNPREVDTIRISITYCVPGKCEPTGCFATSVRRFG